MSIILLNDRKGVDAEGVPLLYGPQELVLGKEQFLFEQIEPLLHRGDVRLDLSRVQLLDAAGIGALVTLEEMARRRGHVLQLVHPSLRVARLFALFGLRELLTQS